MSHTDSRLLTPFISCVWPDQSILEGEGWVNLEEKLRAQQWDNHTRSGFRREMRRRAKVWSGRRVPIRSAEAMFRGLEKVGMIRLFVEGEDNARSHH